MGLFCRRHRGMGITGQADDHDGDRPCPLWRSQGGGPGGPVADGPAAPVSPQRTQPDGRYHATHPASLSARPENAAAPTIPATSGPTSPVSLPSAAPSGSSSRMSPVTSASALKPCCESFGTWATRLRRACSVRQKLARRTSGSASSSWPTPAAQNWKGSSPASVTRTDGKSRMNILHYRAEQGFIRPDPMISMAGRRSSPHAPISRLLWAYLIASHGRVVSRRILKARARRRLNPLFVGWLMGWPIGHALCGCSATEFTHWQQRMRGALSQLPMASGPWIWRPSEGSQSPAQMNLFEGVQP